MIRYGNEFSFYDRLEDIVSRTKTLSQGRVMEIDNAVLRSVVDTRNYHTHYSEKLRAKAAKGADLVFLNEMLAFMCMCIIFEALGRGDLAFEVSGEGETDPIAPNAVNGAPNPDGQARNRRVTITYEAESSG